MSELSLIRATASAIQECSSVTLSKPAVAAEHILVPAKVTVKEAIIPALDKACTALASVIEPEPTSKAPSSSASKVEVGLSVSSMLHAAPEVTLPCKSPAASAALTSPGPEIPAATDLLQRPFGVTLTEVTLDAPIKVNKYVRKLLESMVIGVSMEIIDDSNSEEE
jgi:hypothetical protein